MNRHTFFTLCAVSLTLGLLGRPAAAPPAPVGAFDKAVGGFLETHCLRCHGAAKARADLRLDGYKDDAAILKDRQRWVAVLTQVQTGAMPPPERPRPDAAAVDAFVTAVEAVFERADGAAGPDPGRVTVRRLNRTEYANTVRDLTGIDFNPAEDFPPDDVGYGFDNVGDVLTLPPLLMERYLAAAESIVQRAIVPDPPKPPNRHTAARFTEPAGADVPQGRFRPITTRAGKKLIETGPLFTGFQVPNDGDYTFRTRVYATAEGGGPVEVAILAAGKGLPNPAGDAEAARLSGHAILGLQPFTILKTVTVKADSEKTAEVIEVPIPPLAPAELKRVAVALVKRPADRPATLFVEYLALEGPRDTRPATHRRLLAYDPGQPHAEQTRAVLRRFASRAYRRPATAPEVERLAKLVEAAEARGEKWEAGMQLAFQAVLVSPKFLFRWELDDRPGGAPSGPKALDDYQLASRLSYFLWGTLPDEDLFRLAEQRRLAADLPAQVRRMLQDPKALALVDNFGLQWLQLRRLKGFAPDARLFPTFDDRLRNDMLHETELFLRAILQEDRSVLELVDADFTFLNERLARHYGIADTQGNPAGPKPVRPGGQPIRGEAFVRVRLAGPERGGLLTMASVLTVTSNPTRTSPVKRGRWVLEQILGTPPPPPPPDVPELKEDAGAQLTGSLRQRMEQHRANPACASCHARMDPLGFAFENYNAVGAFRQKDGEHAIDPSGTLPDGRTFQGPGELKAILRDKKDLVRRNLAEKLLTYALGRGLEYSDRRAVREIVRQTAAGGDRFSALVIAVVQSDPFRLRRGEDGPAGR